jgi:hypothetical protein
MQSDAVLTCLKDSGLEAGTSPLGCAGFFSLAGPYGGAQDEQQNFWQMIVLQCDITGL